MAVMDPSTNAVKVRGGIVDWLPFFVVLIRLTYFIGSPNQFKCIERRLKKEPSVLSKPCGTY